MVAGECERPIGTSYYGRKRYLTNYGEMKNTNDERNKSQIIIKLIRLRYKVYSIFYNF